MRRAAVILTAGVALAGGCVTQPVEPTTVRAAPPEPVEADHLALAAACIDRGDEPAAVTHLSAHVKTRPDAVMIRAYLAELLLKCGRPADARAQFERFTRDAAGQDGKPRQHLVHCHTRLMEIAERDGDRYAEHLHRGIALLLLVRQWEGESRSPSPRATPELIEPTLAKAAAALRQAAEKRPTHPRPRVYLAEVYDRLGQPSAARSQAKRVAGMLPDPSLTADEVNTVRQYAD
jgi:Tfp pilus assembly protein PilF